MRTDARGSTTVMQDEWSEVLCLAKRIGSVLVRGRPRDRVSDRTEAAGLHRDPIRKTLAARMQQAQSGVRIEARGIAEPAGRHLSQRFFERRIVRRTALANPRTQEFARVVAQFKVIGLIAPAVPARTEERRGGKRGVSTGRSRWSPDH